jgi:hypothetical protein
MNEALTPAKLVAKWRGEDKERMDELEARVKALEGHYHYPSDSGGQRPTGGPVCP